MGRTSWLALGAVAGALAVEYAPSLLVPLAAASCAIGAGFLVAGARPLESARRAAALALVAGLLLICGRAGVGMTVPPTQQDPIGVENASGFEHEAVVLSVSTPSGGLQRAVLELRPPEPAERVYSWLPRYPPVAPGDVVRVGGLLEPALTEGGFGEYLARSGLGSTVRARTLERLGVDGSPVAALEGLRRASAGLITRVLPEPQAGLATAMAIGLRDLVARDVADDFRISGLSHVVAISGWHIALLGAVVSGLLSNFSRRPRSFLVLVTICSYAILAGGSPSVLRAAVMASVVLLARESGRRGRASAALGVTCVGLLLLDPATVTDLGFQLSVAATAGLLAWASRLRGWLAGRLPAHTPGWLLEALAVSLAAQAATLPLVLFHFGRLSLVAPLANLVVAPLVAPAMLLTALAFVAGAMVALGVPAVVLAPFTLVGTLGIGAMIAVAEVMAGLPYASVELAPPLNLAAAGASLLLLARAVRPRRRAVGDSTRREPRSALNPRRRMRLAVIAGAVSLCFLLATVAVARPDGRLHVTVLDIGQGDAILLQGPNGGRMLVDTGPDPDRLLALLDARVPAWDRRLDLVVLTHPHEDHVAGLALLLDRYRIGEIIEPGMVGPGPGDVAYRRRLAELGRDSRVVAAGDRLWLDGIILNVHWPMRGTVPIRPADSGTAINNVSIVLELEFGQRRMLFTGDIEEQIDPQLLAAGIARPNHPLDVLKVAHHGSRTATTDVFVERAAPRVAIVSAGYGNPYGHPSPQTVARLKESGAQLFRTDLDGSVEITTDGKDLVARTDGGRPLPQRPSPTPVRGVGFCPVPATTGGRRRPTYNRRDVDSLAGRGGGDRAPPLNVAAPADPFHGRGRGMRLHLRCAGGTRRGRRRPAGRIRRAAARHGQGARAG